MPLIARKGDRHTHGGEIEEGGRAEAEGRAIARVGDRVSCPDHGTQEIVEGSSRVVEGGRGVAYHGARTSCGAKIIATAANTTVEE